MKPFLLLFVIVALLHIPAAFCFSQSDSLSQYTIKVILRDGSELIGYITAQDSTDIQFTTLSNISMVIPQIEIHSVHHLSGTITNGTYIRSDPNNTRLFFAPTARSLSSGQGYFSAYQIFFPFIAFGIKDVAILAGGMSLFPGVKEQLVYFAPKITPIQFTNGSIAGGVLYMSSTSGSSDGAGIYYSVVTLGNQHASFTGGLGWGFSGSETADKPIILLGGELRTSNSIKLISENWILPNSDVHIISFGVRFFGENLAADLGLIRLAGSEMEGFPFIPWLGFSYNFGTAK